MKLRYWILGLILCVVVGVSIAKLIDHFWPVAFNSMGSELGPAR